MSIRLQSARRESPYLCHNLAGRSGVGQDPHGLRLQEPG